MSLSEEIRERHWPEKKYANGWCHCGEEIDECLALKAANELDRLQANLAGLRDAECEGCGRSLPPDGDCYGCELDELQAWAVQAREVLIGQMPLSDGRVADVCRGCGVVINDRDPWWPRHLPECWVESLLAALPLAAPAALAAAGEQHVR